MHALLQAEPHPDLQSFEHDAAHPVPQPPVQLPLQVVEQLEPHVAVQFLPQVAVHAV